MRTVNVKGKHAIAIRIEGELFKVFPGENEVKDAVAAWLEEHDLLDGSPEKKKPKKSKDKDPEPEPVEGDDGRFEPQGG